jgi:hypothetical protein
MLDNRRNMYVAACFACMHLLTRCSQVPVHFLRCLRARRPEDAYHSISYTLLGSGISTAEQHHGTNCCKFLLPGSRDTGQDVSACLSGQDWAITSSCLSSKYGPIKVLCQHILTIVSQVRQQRPMLRVKHRIATHRSGTTIASSSSTCRK